MPIVANVEKTPTMMMGITTILIWSASVESEEVFIAKKYKTPPSTARDISMLVMIYLTLLSDDAYMLSF